MDPQEAKRAHILLLLSDSNIPTGGFVASAGLESYYAHGLLGARASPQSGISSATKSGGGARDGPSRLPNQSQLAASTLMFASHSLTSYARSSLAFISDAHALCYAAMTSVADGCADGKQAVALVLEGLDKLDATYHALTMNHVVRRASLAQGIALLTLYGKAFARADPLPLPAYTPSAGQRSGVDSAAEVKRRDMAASLVDAFKLAVRKEISYGHLAICWGVFTAALGLDRAASLHLHLFLVCRSLLSSSVRLNTMGPYMAQQLTLFHLPPIVDEALTAACATVKGAAYPDEELHPTCTTALADTCHAALRSARGCSATVQHRTELAVDDKDASQSWAWDWEDEGAWALGWDDPSEGAEGGTQHPLPPAQTWPLGELVQGRHDQLHSRLFNS